MEAEAAEPEDLEYMLGVQVHLALLQVKQSTMPVVVAPVVDLFREDLMVTVLHLDSTEHSGDKVAVVAEDGPHAVRLLLMPKMLLPIQEEVVVVGHVDGHIRAISAEDTTAEQAEAA